MMLKYLQDSLIEISRHNGISNLSDSISLVSTTFLSCQMLSADLVTQTLGLTDKVISTVLLVQISLSPFTLYLTI